MENYFVVLLRLQKKDTYNKLIAKDPELDLIDDCLEEIKEERIRDEESEVNKVSVLIAFVYILLKIISHIFIYFLYILYTLIGLTCVLLLLSIPSS